MNRSNETQGGRQFNRDKEDSQEITEGVRFGDRLDPQLFAAIAESKARTIASCGDKNKSTQLRRFYDELVKWHAKIGRSKAEFEAQQPYLYMLKAMVAYARARDHVDHNFETLFRHVIDQCVCPTTLGQAKLFMEAFMAFHKVHASDSLKKKGN